MGINQRGCREHPVAAIITSGSLTEFSIRPIAVSTEPRGLALARLRLDSRFRLFLGRMFDKTSDVYFLAWCWDLSGMPTSVYPGVAADPSSALIPIRGGEVREFIGTGTVLFPARPVTAGLGVRIHIWKSARERRDFSRTLSTVTDVIQKSQLNSLLTLSAATRGGPEANLAIVDRAAQGLSREIDAVLRANSEDHHPIHLYEGYFPAVAPWTDSDVKYLGHASEIVFTQFSRALPRGVRLDEGQRRQIAEALHAWAEVHPRRDLPVVALIDGSELTPIEMARAAEEPESPRGQHLLRVFAAGLIADDVEEPETLEQILSDYWRDTYRWRESHR
jgi:hypothetical protein